MQARCSDIRGFGVVRSVEEDSGEDLGRRSDETWWAGMKLLMCICYIVCDAPSMRFNATVSYLWAVISLYEILAALLQNTRVFFRLKS